MSDEGRERRKRRRKGGGLRVPSDNVPRRTAPTTVPPTPTTEGTATEESQPSRSVSAQQAAVAYSLGTPATEGSGEAASTRTKRATTETGLGVPEGRAAQSSAPVRTDAAAADDEPGDAVPRRLPTGWSEPADATRVDPDPHESSRHHAVLPPLHLADDDAGVTMPTRAASEGGEELTTVASPPGEEAGASEDVDLDSGKGGATPPSPAVDLSAGKAGKAGEDESLDAAVTQRVEVFADKGSPLPALKTTLKGYPSPTTPTAPSPGKVAPPVVAQPAPPSRPATASPVAKPAAEMPAVAPPAAEVADAPAVAADEPAADVTAKAASAASAAKAAGAASAASAAPVPPLADPSSSETADAPVSSKPAPSAGSAVDGDWTAADSTPSNGAASSRGAGEAEAAAPVVDGEAAFAPSPSVTPEPTPDATDSGEVKQSGDPAESGELLTDDLLEEVDTGAYTAAEGEFDEEPETKPGERNMAAAGRRTARAETVVETVEELSAEEIVELGGQSDSAAPPKPPPAPPAKPKAAPASPPVAPQSRKRKGKPWFEEIFDEDYLRTLPFLTPQATQAESLFVLESLGVEPGAQVLDVGCGYGRHAMELAARGMHVVGLDLSLPLLIRGADEAQRRGLNINFVHGDMRELTFDAQFDGAYCLFGTFGFFDDETNKKAAQNVARALKPGGRFVIDVLNRDYLVADLPSRVWWEGDGCVVLEEVEFNYFSSRIVSNRSVVFDDGRQLEQEISMRAYSLHELGKLLHAAGFRILEVSGSIETRGRFFGSHSRSILVVCERRPPKDGD